MAKPTDDALDYHSGPPRPGKLEIRATKPMATALDLSLAYTPGVAEPCRRIAEDPARVFDYTNRGNLVAVVSNGTAVLGLGNIGPAASKPVMEGKAVLFKRFADIDVFDIELDASDIETVVTVVKALEPTFGGINLEDIRAPEAFYIEERLREEMSIPVFHDDQHGTAIITSAALVNALELTGRQPEEVRLTVSGAGAAAIACVNLFLSLGVRRENVLMCDSRGVLSAARQITDPFKKQFVQDTSKKTLAEAMDGADVFLGLSVGGVVDAAMVKAMADRPIIFALANPDPEILPPDVRAARPDAVVATGRSDFANQVNNVLGFPFIFRGALDVQATGVNEEMKLAAVHALAKLAREPVPASVSAAYGGRSFTFGPDYIIPKPFDPRVLGWVAPAVAKAAMDSGVARRSIDDWDAYRLGLERMMSSGRGLMRQIHDQAKNDPKRIVFAEGSDQRVIKAASTLAREGLARPVLMGLESDIQRVAAEVDADLEGVEIIYPPESPHFDEYVHRMVEVGKRSGFTHSRAHHDMQSRTNFGLMMVSENDADGMVLGAQRAYSQGVKPALRIVGTGGRRACGVYMVLTPRGTLFFADTTVNIDPTAEMLRDITLNVVEMVRNLGLTPRVAMLSFASFGAVRHPDCRKMAEATELVRETDRDLMIEGEIQVDAALDMDFRAELYPWSRLTEQANVFIFPNLTSANIAYKLLHQLGDAYIFGPLLLGMARPVNVLALNSDPSDIVNLACWTAVQAQSRRRDLRVAE